MAETFTFFGREISIKLASLAGAGGLGILIIFMIISGMAENNKELDHVRLAMEDESLLCSNDEYSTTYTTFVYYPDVTEEMIEEKKIKVLENIELMTKTLNYAKSHPMPEHIPKQHKAYIAEIEYKLIELNKQLERVEAGKRTEFFSGIGKLPSMGVPGSPEEQKYNDIKKYTIDYVSETNPDNLFINPLVNLSDEELGYKIGMPRFSMITLDKESYIKWADKLTARDSDLRKEAIEDISDLKCLESITFPKVGTAGVSEFIEEELHWPDGSTTPIERGFGGTIDLAPLTNFVNLKILDVEYYNMETESKKGTKSIFKNMPNLKILKLGSIDKTCEDVEPDYRGNPDYYIRPPHTHPCEPEDYFNVTNERVFGIPKKPEYPSSNTGKVNTYDNPTYENCGSDISALRELKHLRRLAIEGKTYWSNRGVIKGIAILSDMHSLRHFTLAQSQPTDFSEYTLKLKTELIEKDSEDFDHQPENLEELMSETTNDAVLENGQFLLIPKNYFPNLEYLDITGNILTAPFDYLEDLSELYIGPIQNDRDVNFEYLKTFTQLERLEIAAPLLSGFCDSLKKNLEHTTVVCKESQTMASRVMEDLEKRMHERQYIIDPYSEASYVEHRAFEYERKDLGDLEDPDDDTVEIINREYTYSLDYESGLINIQWDMTGDWSDLLDGAKEKQKALDAKYDRASEMMLTDVEEIAITETTMEKVGLYFYSCVAQDFAYEDSIEQHVNYYLHSLDPDKDRYLVKNICVRGEEPIVTYYRPVPKRDSEGNIIKKIIIKEKWEHVPELLFNYKYYNPAAPPDLHGSKTIAICDVMRADKAMWKFEYDFYKNNQDKEYPYIPSSSGEDWEELTLRGKTFSFSKRNLVPPPLATNMSYFLRTAQSNYLNPYMLNDIDKYVIDMIGSAEKLPIDLKPLYRGDPLPIQVSPMPILLSPGDGIIVTPDKQITFSWKIPENAHVPTGVNYFWHATINGQELPGALYRNGIDVGDNTEFVYTPGTFDLSLEQGVWEWSVRAFTLESGNFLSRTNTLNWSEDSSSPELPELPEIEPIPILLSPDNEAEFSNNEDIIFTWELPSGMVLPPGARYYWHTIINGQEPFWYENQYGIPVGRGTSFIYSPDIYPAQDGVLQWNIVTSIPGKGEYWSETRILFREDIY